MKYLALIYTDPSIAPPPDPSRKMLAAYQAANAVFQRDGVMLAGEALQPTSTATSVRVRNGETETIDGPFAETKEQLGGFYMFDCANLDDAIKYAAMIPGAAHGTVEVRPVVVFA
ncbi:hypothetical protein DFR52_10169 [Hoeflea marina]|uniref:YCII-related domain-containing protein n=1 Tax=Hoeflea marina TaxID=274592 RepID=A0A317PQB8_9HYPH|nr:YciI family protein [Hoeflea marina]PWW03389.1 hypothetical protein DFR52_10169 [Hoeflea marina]